MSNILILSASTGGGHNAAAKSLKKIFEKKNYDVEIVDALKIIDKHIITCSDNPIFTVRNRIYRTDVDIIICCRKPCYSAKMCCPAFSELEVVVFIEHTDILCRVVRFFQVFRFVIIIEFIASKKCCFIFRFCIFLFSRHLPNSLDRKSVV